MALPSSGPLSLNDIQTEFGGTNPIGMNEYYAGGGLVPAGTSGTYGAVPSSGTISIQNFYGTSNFVPVYIEDVFSTYIYTANNTTQTITNNINLSANGGLIWFKTRNTGGAGATHTLVDSARGNNGIYSSLSNAQGALSVGGGGAGTITLNTNGFTINGSVYSAQGNINFGTTDSLVSWTFRKQPKFFDVVTYTGDGTAGRAISHNLGSVPGCVIVKRTDSSANWVVWHRSLSNPSKFLILDSTAAEGTDVNGPWGPFSSGYTTNASAFTSTVFRVANDIRSNASGATYVAYIFAHDAGGFGLTGTDNVISCGSFTAPAGSASSINLGYEPQWLLVRATSTTDDWLVADNMRGFQGGSPTAQGNPIILRPNTSQSEGTVGQFLYLEPTGFNVQTGVYSVGTQFIYIAIRRGPMKTPTSGTSVFSPNIFTTDNVKQTTGFPVDMLMGGTRGAGANWAATVSRLQGLNSTRTSGSPYPRLLTSSTTSELSGTNIYYGYDNTGYISGGLTGSTSNVAWSFGRAPGFFDVVCYSGTGVSGLTVNHNLGVQPELMIFKERKQGFTGWFTAFNFTASTFNIGYINADTGGYGNRTYTSDDWLNSRPTATSFTLKTNGDVNGPSGWTYVTYLFATVAGVSKVGIYTGTGALQTINCGFTSGTRFVLIKRIDANGDWFVYDSARGISSGNDPYSVLNTTGNEVNGTNYVDTTSVGFQVTAAAPAGINASGGTYLFLAIA